MNHNELYQKIHDVEPQVRFSGILNFRGDIIVENNRDDSEKLLSTDEVKMSVHYTFQRWTSSQNLGHRIGKEKINISEFVKVTLMSLLLNDENLPLLSLEPGANYIEIIFKVKQLLPDQ
jgi:hypothetical protein